MNSMHERLRQAGLRATPQRLAVAGFLFAGPRHETAQSIFEALRPSYPSMSPNTVYLTLSHFERAGLVKRLYVDGTAVFDSNVTPHNHAYCTRCKKLVDVPAEQETPPNTLAGWALHDHSHTWLGLCPECREQSQA